MTEQSDTLAAETLLPRIDTRNPRDRSIKERIQGAHITCGPTKRICIRADQWRNQSRMIIRRRRVGWPQHDTN